METWKPFFSIFGNQKSGERETCEKISLAEVTI